MYIKKKTFLRIVFFTKVHITFLKVTVKFSQTMSSFTANFFKSTYSQDQVSENNQTIYTICVLLQE